MSVVGYSVSAWSAKTCANSVSRVCSTRSCPGTPAGTDDTDQDEPEAQPFDDLDGPDDADDADAAVDSKDLTQPQRFRPHQITPDSRFSLGFDPRKLIPSVTMHLHLYARTDTGEGGPVARWEGEGPITTAYLREVLGPACELTVKPVIDLAAMAPVDAYEIPDRHREAVHLRTGSDDRLPSPDQDPQHVAAHQATEHRPCSAGEFHAP